MEEIKLWNKLCDFLESCINIHPVFFGPRLLLFDTIRKSPFSIKNLLVAQIIKLFLIRKKREDEITISDKIIYVLDSPSVASFSQADAFTKEIINNQMNQKILLIIGNSFAQNHGDWLLYLKNNNISWICRESTPIYNSFFSLLLTGIKAIKYTYKLQHLLKKKYIFNNLIFDFKEISLFLFQDLINYSSFQFLINKFGKPRIVFSATDMVAGSHAYHALCSKLSIQNYVYQHGTLGILQARHHPGTSVIVWGDRQKYYLEKVGCKNKIITIGSLRFKDYLKDNLYSKVSKEIKTGKFILILSGGISKITRTMTDDYIDNYMKSLKEFAFNNLYRITIKPHPSENFNKNWKDFIEMKNIQICDKKVALIDLFDNAYLCITDFSTSGYEAMIANVPTIFYYPYNNIPHLKDLIGINVPEQTISSYLDLNKLVWELINNIKYRKMYLERQRTIVNELFVPNDIMELRINSLLNN